MKSLHLHSQTVINAEKNLFNSFFGNEKLPVQIFIAVALRFKWKASKNSPVNSVVNELN